MRGRVRGVVATAALVLGISATGLLTGGTASAAEPIVVGDCSTSVRGTPGQPVSLAPAAVLGVVTDAVRAVPILGPPLAGTANKAFAALPPIPIGALPTGSGYISGATIANAVVAEVRKLPLGSILGTVAQSVQGTLTSICGVAVTGANAVAAPVQDGTKAVADASEEAVSKVVPGGVGSAPGGSPGTGTPGGGSGSGGGTPSTGMPGPNQPPVGGYQPGGWSLYQPGLWNFGRWPMADYGSVPYAQAGLFAPSPGVRYGGSVPGYTPEFGILGTDNPGDGVQAAGRAEALTPPEGQKIALPVLLAVLALSVVTAGLVRTWVLRRAPGAAL